MKDKRTSKTDQRFYSLRDAAYTDVELAAKIIRSDPSIVHAKNSIGETTLHFLVVENALTAVEFLAANGSDVNTKNAFGTLAIIEAAELGYVQMVELLLRLGAAVDPKRLVFAAPEDVKQQMSSIIEARKQASVERPD